MKYSTKRNHEWNKYLLQAEIVAEVAIRNTDALLKALEE